MKKYSYVTLLTNNSYIPGVVLLKESLRRVRSKYPLLCLITEDVDQKGKELLTNLKINFRKIDKIKTPDNIMQHNLKVSKERALHWKDVLTKFNIFNLIEFDKIIFLDADLLIWKNVDHCFDMPHMTAALDGEYSNLWPLFPHFNAGFIVIEPNVDLFKDICLFANNLDTDKVKNFAGKDYVIADQEILNLYYKDWKDEKEKHLDKYYNVFPPHCPRDCEQDLLDNGYFFHFVGMKPWNSLNPRNFPISEVMSICSLDMKEEKRCDIFYEIAFTIIELGLSNPGIDIDWEQIEKDGTFYFLLALKCMSFFKDFNTAKIYIDKALKIQPDKTEFLKLKEEIEKRILALEVKPIVLDVLKRSLSNCQKNGTPTMDIFQAIDMMSKTNMDTEMSIYMTLKYWNIIQKSVEEYIKSIYNEEKWDELMYS